MISGFSRKEGLHQRFPHHQHALLLLLKEAIKKKNMFTRNESRTRQEPAKRNREMFLTKFCHSADNTILVTVGEK
jgi:hypothetical protein